MRALALILFVLLLAACGVKGDPLPPLDTSARPSPLPSPSTLPDAAESAR